MNNTYFIVEGHDIIERVVDHIQHGYAWVNLYGGDKAFMICSTLVHKTKLDAQEHLKKDLELEIEMYEHSAIRSKAKLEALKKEMGL
ncbi:MAG: hypothetical protein EHM34_04280 [Nitrosopumilales archaeon]|nr:MAG: hypothetical protein EHM34_04280 [Nitrosopumilales archaeon]